MKNETKIRTETSEGNLAFSKSDVPSHESESPIVKRYYGSVTGNKEAEKLQNNYDVRHHAS